MILFNINNLFHSKFVYPPPVPAESMQFQDIRKIIAEQIKTLSVVGPQGTLQLIL